MADPQTVNYVNEGIDQHEEKIVAQLVAFLENLEGSGVVATIRNKSSWDFTITNFEPNHGAWADYRPHPLRCVNSIVKLLRAEKPGRQSDSDKEMYLNLFQDYKLSGYSPTLLSGAMIYAIKGAGIGSEALVRLTPDNPACGAVIFLLIRKIPGGDFGAGVAIYGPGDVASWTLDQYGTKIINFIKNAPATPPVEAEGEQFSEGATKTAKNGPLKVTFAGSETVKFVIENNY